MSEADKVALVRHVTDTMNGYEDVANRVLAEANSTESDLSGQLMLVSTVVLTAVLLALGNADLFKLLTDSQKTLISLVLILQVVSIILGIIAYKDRITFFVGASDNAKKSVMIADSFNYESIESMKQKINENVKSFTGKSTDRYLNLQIWSIVIGLLVFAVVILSVLFNVHFPWDSTHTILVLNTPVA